MIDFIVTPPTPAFVMPCITEVKERDNASGNTWSHSVGVGGGSCYYANKMTMYFYMVKLLLRYMYITSAGLGVTQFYLLSEGCQ